MNEIKASTSEKIIKANFFTLLRTYIGFFIIIFSNFLIARLLSDEEWGFLILGLSTVLILGILFGYFPLATNLTLNQYIPRYKYKNILDQLKSLNWKKKFF